MKHKDYWKQRFTQLENAQHGLTAASYAEIEAMYRAAQKEIEAKIAVWYQRFADNNGISMGEARQWLSGNALKEFKWDVKEYIKYGKENALLGGAWMQELENASAKFHISKLEALKIQTQHSLEVLFSKQQSTIADTLGDVFQSGYYHTAYELQKGFGIGFDVAAVDQSYLEKVLSKPWAADGKNFSERVWGNKNKLIQEVHTELSRNILTGGDPQKAIDALSKKFQTSKYNAGRLIQTEQAYFSSAAQKECFNDLGVEEYEIVATLDSHTSDICQNLDGQHFPMKDFEAGVTAPPFHVNCRSTTAPYFSETFGQIGQRAARDAETGKTYYVPDDLKYADWKAAFVNGDKSGFDVSAVDGVTHYKHPPQPEPPPPPKKEYLTEKKLKANIANADVELEDLEKQADQVLSSTGYTYDEIKQAGGVEQFYKSETLADQYYKIADEKAAIEDKYGGYDALWDHGADADIVKYDSLDDDQIKLETALKKQGLKIDGFGHIENLTHEDAIKALQDKAKLDSIASQMEQITTQKAEWEEKLSVKLIAKEKKALTKQKIALEAQLDQAKQGVKTYSGIWQHDVTTSDWSHLNIAGKKQYYEGKLLTETDPALVQKYQDYLSQLQELDSEGKALYDVQMELAKVEKGLKNLENGGKIKGDSPFTQERKDAALWFDSQHGGFQAADAYFDPPAKAIHKAATAKERDGFYTYTSGSGGHNRPLAGFQKPWAKSGTGWEDQFYVGPKKVWIDYEGKGEQIRGLTTLIEKSSYDQDVWLQSGQDFATLEGLLGVQKGTVAKMSEAALQQFVGRRERFYQFISTAVNEGGGSIFNRKPMKFNIYAPKGSQMLYASDVGAFGKGENEMILQRGGSYEITRIYWGKDMTDGGKRKLFVDLEIHVEDGYDTFQQDPAEWTGSKKNYHS